MITILVIATVYFLLETLLSETIKNRKLLEVGIGFFAVGVAIFILNLFWYVPIVGARYSVEPVIGDDFSTDLGVIFFIILGLLLIIIDFIYSFFKKTILDK